MRRCGICDGPIRGADLMCERCLTHVSSTTRSQLGKTWRAWSRSGSLGAMREYEGAVETAMREATAWQRAHNGLPQLGADGG